MTQSGECLALGGGFRYLPTGDSSGFLEGPDGSRAGLRLEQSDDGAYIALLEKPGQQHWGVYRVGLPVAGAPGELASSLRALLPKFQVLYRRTRVQ